MRTRVTITDLTRMTGPKVCVAGYLPSGECIRPVPRFGALAEPWLFHKDGPVIRPFAVIELDLIRPVPDLVPPHTEDWEIQLGYRHCRDLDPSERYAFLCDIIGPHVRALFGAELQGGENERGRWLRRGDGTRSLGTVRVMRVHGLTFRLNDYGRREYRLRFADDTGEVFNLPVTDLAFRLYLDWLVDREDLTMSEMASSMFRTLASREVFLRLGLTRNWERLPDRCYFQINGIYSFPDYLNGRCFADFIPAPVIDAPF